MLKKLLKETLDKARSAAITEAVRQWLWPIVAGVVAMLSTIITAIQGALSYVGFAGYVATAVLLFLLFIHGIKWTIQVMDWLAAKAAPKPKADPSVTFGVAERVIMECYDYADIRQARAHLAQLARQGSLAVRANELVDASDSNILPSLTGPNLILRREDFEQGRIEILDAPKAGSSIHGQPGLVAPSGIRYVQLRVQLRPLAELLAG